MPAAVVLALKDLRQRLRDRSVLVLGFLAPLAVAGLISMAFGSVSAFHTTVAVIDHDRGPVAAGFSAFLADPGVASIVTVRTVASEAEARRLVTSGTLGAAFVVPAGYSGVMHGEPAKALTVLTGVDAPIAAQVARSLAESFNAQVDADRLSVATALAAGVPAARVAELTAAAATQRLPEQVVRSAAGTKAPNAVSYYAPAMGIFFMFFAIGFGSRGYFLERAGGTLDRIAAAPVRAGAILAGKSLSTFVYGVASLSTVALVTSLAFHADWGPPLVAAALIVALGLTMVSLTAFVIAVARTERQAEGLAAMVTFGLVLTGGNFIFVGAAPPAIRTLSLFTPNGWALRAFTDLSAGAQWSAAVQPLLAILAFAVVIGAIAALLARRRTLAT